MKDYAVFSLDPLNPVRPNGAGKWGSLRVLRLLIDRGRVS
jgi:hypothetical protein